MTKSRTRAAAPPLAVAISEQLFITKTVGDPTLLDAMLEAARARGFVALDVTPASEGTTAARLLPLTREGVPGARVRADLGPHALPIATAAARAMGSPVTLLIVSGTATGSRGRLEISLSVQAMDIDRSGKSRARRGPLGSPADYTQVDDLDWGNSHALVGAARDRAGIVLGEAAHALDLSLGHDGEPIVHGLLRPTGSDRVEAILSLLADANGYELSGEPDGRVVVKITLEAGKRMAFLSPEEATELKKRLAPRT
jgi:hypothetical protein